MDEVVPYSIHLAKAEPAIERMKGATKRVDFLCIRQAEDWQLRGLSGRRDLVEGPTSPGQSGVEKMGGIAQFHEGKTKKLDLFIQVLGITDAEGTEEQRGSNSSLDMERVVGEEVYIHPTVHRFPVH